MRPRLEWGGLRVDGSWMRAGILALLLGIAWSQAGPGLVGPAHAQRVTLEFDEDDSDSTTTGTVPGRSGTYRVRSNDMVRFGESVVVESDERIRGDVVVFGGSIRVRGYVDGDAVSVGGSVIIEDGGEVRGEAISVGGQVEEHGEGRLRGTSLTLPGSDWKDVRHRRRYDFGLAENFIGALIWLAFLLFFGWLATHLAPTRLALVRQQLRENPLASFLWGLAAFVLFVPALLVVVFAAVLLMITILGIPLGIALLLGYPVAFALLLVAGYLVGSSALGAWLAPRLGYRAEVPSEARLMVIGILGGFGLVAVGKLLKALWFVGFFGGLFTTIGWIVASLAVFMGTGALLSSGFGVASLRWVRRTPPAVPPSPPGAPPPPSPAPPGPPPGPSGPGGPGVPPPPPPPPALPAS